MTASSGGFGLFTIGSGIAGDGAAGKRPGGGIPGKGALLPRVRSTDARTGRAASCYESGGLPSEGRLNWENAMSVLSKVLGFFGKKDASKADAKPAGPAARKASAKGGAGKAETKVVGKTAGKAAAGRTEAATPVSKADAAKEALKARNKAARKARKRNQS
jgi:hypothetical protein